MNNHFGRLWAMTVATMLSPCLTGAAPAAPANRPNIVIIMADDMGFSDLGCYGGEVQTPHLDRLARGGMRFTQFYNGARCCPTRAALLTGLHPHQAGVGHMVNNLGPPAYQGFLNDRCVTLAEVLRDAGYQTLMSGKWHVGENRPHWPTDRGFDRYYGLISGASSYFQLDPKRQMAVQDQPYTPPTNGYYITDAFTDYAVQFLEEAGRTNRPFFLYLAYTSPHWPVHARPEDIAKYRGKYREGWDVLRGQRHQRMIQMGLVQAAWPLVPRDVAAPAWETLSEEERDRWDHRMAAYAAQIDRMDQNIGRVLEKIRQLGRETNTLILFLADNGGCAEKVNRGKLGAAPGTRESYLSYGLPWAQLSNTPFRLYKHWVHEGGIATPLIAYWPAEITKTGGLSHQPGQLVDLMATCVDVAGATYPKTYRGRQIPPPEGLSLRPAFRGEPPIERTLYWEHEGNRAVRKGDWKLVAKHRSPWELFNLADNRTETRNVAAERPDKVAELLALYEAWTNRAGVLPWKPGKPAKPAKAEPATPPAPEDETHYLFTSFRGNGESGLFLALSQDGLQWTPLKKDTPFLRPTVGEHKLMRDPCLVQGPDETYHLVWTTGWTASQAPGGGHGGVVGYAASRDLVQWSPQKAIPVMENEPATRNVWAPELFYDEAAEQWLMFWSSTVPGKFPDTDATGDDRYNHRIYCTTTKDFRAFTPSRLFYDPGFNVIDATLLKAGDKFYLFFKDERKNPLKKNLRYAVGARAEGPFGPPSEPFTGDWVEGPSAIKIKEDYLVYFDHYARPHYYGAVRSRDLNQWEDCSKEMRFPPGHRHGSVLQIPRELAARLKALE